MGTYVTCGVVEAMFGAHEAKSYASCNAQRINDTQLRTCWPMVQVLACLVPWVGHVVLDKREGARTGELLALLYQVTFRCVLCAACFMLRALWFPTPLLPSFIDFRSIEKISRKKF